MLAPSLLQIGNFCAAPLLSRDQNCLFSLPPTINWCSFFNYFVAHKMVSIMQYRFIIFIPEEYYCNVIFPIYNIGRIPHHALRGCSKITSLSRRRWGSAVDVRKVWDRGVGGQTNALEKNLTLKIWIFILTTTKKSNIIL